MQAYGSVKEGIATQIWCAISPLLSNFGDVYFENTDIAILNKDFDPNENWSDNVEKISGVMPFALDAEAPEKIWNLREGAYRYIV